jgi:hypothetical protein
MIVTTLRQDNDCDNSFCWLVISWMSVRSLLAFSLPYHRHCSSRVRGHEHTRRNSTDSDVDIKNSDEVDARQWLSVFLARCACLEALPMGRSSFFMNMIMLMGWAYDVPCIAFMARRPFATSWRHVLLTRKWDESEQKSQAMHNPRLRKGHMIAQAMTLGTIAQGSHNCTPINFGMYCRRCNVDLVLYGQTDSHLDDSHRSYTKFILEPKNCYTQFAHGWNLNASQPCTFTFYLLHRLTFR